MNLTKLLLLFCGVLWLVGHNTCAEFMKFNVCTSLRSQYFSFIFWEQTTCIGWRLTLGRYHIQSRKLSNELEPKSSSSISNGIQPPWSSMCPSKGQRLGPDTKKKPLFYLLYLLFLFFSGSFQLFPGIIYLIAAITQNPALTPLLFIPGLPGTGTNPDLSQDHAGELIVPHPYSSLPGHQPQGSTNLVSAGRTFPHCVWLHQESHHIHQVSHSSG